MKRQIALSASLFASVFITALWLSLPYGHFAEKALSRIRSDISYSSISSSPLSTEIRGLEIEKLPIGDVEIGYSPARLVTKSISFKSAGMIEGSGRLSMKSVSANITVSGGLIKQLTDQVDFKKPLVISVEGSPIDSFADITAESKELTLKSPIGNLDFKDVRAEINVNGNRINIKSLTSGDETKLSLSGDIILNRNRPESSQTNLRGTLDFLGETKEITLKGRLNNLQPSLR